jgi:hypothetical protein
MSSIFTPCLACARHVKQGDETCPFCGEKVLRPRPPVVRATTQRRSRSALFALSAMGAAVATTECSSSSGTPLYGGPVPTLDASTDAASMTLDDAASEGGAIEGGSAQPLYGASGLPLDGGGNGR